MPPIDSADRRILRELARRKLAIAHDPLNLQRKRLWLDMHETGRCPQPMVLAECNGVRDREAPFAPQLACQGEWARQIETGLRQDIWVFEELRDDHVVEPGHNVNWIVQASDYGVQPIIHRLDDPTHLTATRWDAPVTDIDRDFAKLRPRTFTVDRAQTLATRDALAELFADILPVRIRGAFWWSMGMTQVAAQLVGLENLMLLMYDNPAGLHRVMRFLCDDHLAFIDWLTKENLLSANNENDYTGSGSVGYTRALPRRPENSTEPVTPADLMVLLESQETVGVSPDMFAEFVFPYQQEIARRFGGVYYGCCEPVQGRWEVLRKLPNLRRVSIAPVCNQELMAAALGPDYTFSRKPNPTLISTERFDEAFIRQDLRTTIGLARQHHCPLELIMKDVHTLNNEPQRLARWVQLAREEIAAHAA